MANPARIHLGTSAFTADGWEGVFYPEGLKPADYLAHYATQFGSVEVDSTFYRSPSPDKSSFVNVGDEVEPGKVVCIIEAMKLFNEIESEVKGRIVKVLAEDASPVEYDQPLFLVEPA